MMCEQVLSQWLSKVILKTCNEETKLTYRKFEKLKIRITNERFHLQFNLACINNNLLPNYTNVFDNFSTIVEIFTYRYIVFHVQLL